MNSLRLAIKNAIDQAGESKLANKAYLEFIKANFIIPVEKQPEGEEPRVLFLTHEQNVFLPVFTDRSILDLWAAEVQQDIQVLQLSGVDLLKGIGNEVTVCLDIGSDTYKEFNSAEIERMRSMVLKLFKN